MTGTNRLEQLMDMQRTYALVRRQHAGGKVTFAGKGTIEATPVEQRMIAEWANLVGLETRSAPGSRYTAWSGSREGGIAGFCDDVRVDSGGHATYTSCKPYRRRRGVAPTWERLTSDELTQFYELDGPAGRGAGRAEGPGDGGPDDRTRELCGPRAGPGHRCGQGRHAAVRRGTAPAVGQRHAGALCSACWPTSTCGAGRASSSTRSRKIAAGQQALVTGVSRDSKWWRVDLSRTTRSATAGCRAILRSPSPSRPRARPVCSPAPRGRPRSTRRRCWPPVVRHIYTWTTPSAATRSCRVVYLLSVDDADGNAIPYSSPARALPAPVQQGVVAALSDLPAQFKWVAERGRGQARQEQRRRRQRRDHHAR